MATLREALRIMFFVLVLAEIFAAAYVVGPALLP